MEELACLARNDNVLWSGMGHVPDSQGGVDRSTKHIAEDTRSKEIRERGHRKNMFMIVTI